MLFFILGYLLSFYLPKSPKIRNVEKVRKTWRYHYFTIVCQKSWLYATVFMIYGAWQMYLFFILGLFLPFCLPSSSKNQNLKKRKKKKKRENSGRYYHFTYVYQKLRSDDVRFLRYGVWQRQLFFILGHLLPFQPHNSPKNKN